MDNQLRMKTVISTTDSKKIEAGFKNPEGMLISDSPEIRAAVGTYARGYIAKLHEERKKKKAAELTANNSLESLTKRLHQNFQNAKKAAYQSTEFKILISEQLEIKNKIVELYGSNVLLEINFRLK